MRYLGRIILLTALFALATAPSAMACATCYGASDSPLAKGMNWGIMVLLGFIGSVLAGIVAFFIHVGRNSAKLAASAKPIQPDKLT
jgi:hypothetical protein